VGLSEPSDGKLSRMDPTGGNSREPTYPTTKNTPIIPAILVRICSMVKCIFVSKLRPSVEELLNPFVYFKAEGLWSERISKMRYRFSNKNTVVALLKNPQKVCLICFKSFSKKSNFDKYYFKHQSLLLNVKTANKC
jgi:hypothetical protein